MTFIKRSIGYKPGYVYVVIYLGLMSPQVSSVYLSLSEQPNRLFSTCFGWSLHCSSLSLGTRWSLTPPFHHYHKGCLFSVALFSGLLRQDVILHPAL